ncbi:MAG: DNA polymerase III subunit beta [Thermoanaerobaculia bacterium]
MELRVRRDTFLSELNPMQGIVERRTTIPVLSHLLLAAEGDRLRLAATDLDVSLTSSVPAEIARPGALAVQAKKFAEIVRSVVSEELKITLEDERSLLIQAGKARFRIHGLPAADFPSLPTVEAKAKLEIPLASLRRLVGKILFAVSGEDSRFQLSGALLKIKGKSVELVATDGHRLALVEMPLEGKGAGEDSVLVPRKALQELLRMEGDDKVSFRRGEHHLAFTVGGREMTCRVLEGNFPDYERVIARGNDKKAIVDRKALLDAVRRVAIMTGDRNRGVRLEFGDQEVAIAAANPDLGDASESLACEITGGTLKIGLNPDYLGNFLDAVETSKVHLELKDENSQCVGSPVAAEGEGVAGERYLCVIMPMRI